MATADMDEMNASFFTNLQLLGFDCIDMEGKYKIPFNKDMFNLPNKTGSEAVLHFLFNKLNPTLCREQFRDCWPIIDKKTESQFRKVCHDWLTCIQKEESDAHIPRLNSSLLLSPGGRKFVHMLCSFSVYILVQVMKLEHEWKANDALIYPTVNSSTSSLCTIIKTAIQDSCIREYSRFFENLHLNMAANRQWRTYTDELIKNFRGLTKSCRDLEQEKRLQVNITADFALKQGLSLPAKRTITMFDSDKDVFAVKRAQRIEKVKSQWKQLSNFNENVKDEREIIRSVLDSKTSKFALDGNDMGIRVPGLLLRECNKEIHKREIDNVYNGGRLNLVSLMLLWNICLKLYKEQIESEGLPTVAPDIQQLSTQAHKHHTHLISIQELREEMKNKTIPLLGNSIAQLQRKLMDRGVSKVALDLGTSELDLVLTAPTPPVSTVIRGPSNSETPKGPVAGSVYIHESPEALLTVADNIETTIQRNTSGAFNDINALTGFLEVSQRSSNYKGASHSDSTWTSNENNEKAKKLKPNTKVSHVKKSVKREPGKTLQRRHTATQSTRHHHLLESQGQPTFTSSSPSTPRSSKQKALDTLADSIVDSVLHPSSTRPLELNEDYLSQFSELDDLERTDNNPSDNCWNKVPGSMSPSLHVFKKMSPLSVTSPHNQSFSRSEKNVSNNALIDYDNFISQQFSLKAEETINQNDINDNASQKFQFTGNENISQSFPSDSGISPFKSKQNLTSEAKHSSTSFTNNILSSSEYYVPQYSPSDSIVSEDEASQSLYERLHPFVNDNHKTDTFHKKGVKVSQNSVEILTSISQSSLVSAPGTSENINLFFRQTFSPDPLIGRAPLESSHHYSNSIDLSDRRPGDGQASAELGVQPGRMVLGSKDSDSEEEETDLTTQNNSMPRPQLSKAPSLDFLTTPVHKNLKQTPNKNNHSAKSSVKNNHDVDRQETVRFLSKQDLKTEENKPVAFLQKEPDNYSDLLHNSFDVSELTKNLDRFDMSLEEKLTDVKHEIMTHLIDLEEDMDKDSEQALDDSFVPFKEGICLDSRSPLKRNTTPVKTQQSPRFHHQNTDVTPKSHTGVHTLSTEGHLQAKLALLQQKVSHILDNSLDESEWHSVTKKVVDETSERDWNLAKQINTSQDDDDDILNTDTLNTDLLGVQDLL